MARWAIPEALPVDWPMRTVDSATVTAGLLDDGRFRQRVDHAPISRRHPSDVLVVPGAG